MSISTTCGKTRRASSTAVLGVDQRGEAAAHGRLVVGDEDPDHVSARA
jgi:hypothetical protein